MAWLMRWRERVLFEKRKWRRGAYNINRQENPGMASMMMFLFGSSSAL